MEVGRDPRVLVIPSYTLGYTGSSYVFELTTSFGSEAMNAAYVTGELVKVDFQSYRNRSTSNQHRHFFDANIARGFVLKNLDT